MKFHRMIISGNGRVFIQDNSGDNVVCQFGEVQGKDIDSAKDGEVVESNKGEKFIVYTPSFIDRYKRIKRGAQIITFKDAGIILTTAGLGPESIVAEAGSGSGALTCLLARHCKKVYSYDVEEENLEITKENLENLGFDNVELKKHDIYTGLPDEADCLVLDVPEPWHTIKNLSNIKVGGYIVCYTPSAVQVKQTREAAEEKGLLHVRTVEASERHWMVKGEAVRPTSKNVAFTAFLSFYRYMGENFKSIVPAEKPKSIGPALPDEEFMQEMF